MSDAPTPPEHPELDRAMWEVRVAATEVNGRRVNESMARGEDGPTIVVLCECGRVGCSTTLELPRPEYEAVRTSFDRFLVAPGHELPEVEEVVERFATHVVVEKRGRAAGVAQATDPRA